MAPITLYKPVRENPVANDQLSAVGTCWKTGEKKGVESFQCGRKGSDGVPEMTTGRCVETPKSKKHPNLAQAEYVCAVDGGEPSPYGVKTFQTITAPRTRGGIAGCSTMWRFNGSDGRHNFELKKSCGEAEPVVSDKK